MTNITYKQFEDFWGVQYKDFITQNIFDLYLKIVIDNFFALTNQTEITIKNITDFQKARWNKAQIYAIMFQIIVNESTIIDSDGNSKNIDKNLGIGITTIKLGDLEIQKKLTDQISRDLNINSGFSQRNFWISIIGSNAFKELERSGLLCRRIK